jgi:ribonuclease HI
MSSFYAVAVGKKPGIYTNWNECKVNIDDVKGAIYKKFETIEEASEFIEDYSNSLYVYTDGACTNNGSSNARAGIGIFFSKDSEFNQSIELVGDKLTNNVAELTAIINAIKIIQGNTCFNKYKNKIVVTDSEYAIKCATTYGSKLAEKDWKPKKDKIIPNLDLVKVLYELVVKYEIKFKHVLAHTGNKDRHSIGNYYADLLANKSIDNDQKPSAESEVKKTPKIYLNVKYENKDDAKSKGARWDPNKKQWYIFEDNKNKKELMSKYK